MNSTLHGTLLTSGPSTRKFFKILWALAPSFSAHRLEENSISSSTIMRNVIEVDPKLCAITCAKKFHAYIHPHAYQSQHFLVPHPFQILKKIWPGIMAISLWSRTMGEQVVGIKNTTHQLNVSSVLTAVQISASQSGKHNKIMNFSLWPIIRAT